jgi:hypothetical protein
LLLWGALIGALSLPAVALAQSVPAIPPARTAEQAIANANRLTSRRTAADCRRAAAVAIARGEEDIIVCAAEQDQALPVPEVYGPVYGSTDGRAVDVPTCGLSLQEPCYEGVNLLAVVGFIGDKLLDVFNPDRDLGEGTPIPERFRGANR